jgi:hypothetical protein
MSGRCRLVNGRIRRSILQVIDGLQGIHRTTLYVTGTPCSSGLARPHVHSARSSARPLEPRHVGGSRVGQLAVFRRVPLGDQVAAACPFGRGTGEATLQGGGGRSTWTYSWIAGPAGLSPSTRAGQFMFERTRPNSVNGPARISTSLVSQITLRVTNPFKNRSL